MFRRMSNDKYLLHLFQQLTPIVILNGTLLLLKVMSVQKGVIDIDGRS